MKRRVCSPGHFPLWVSVTAEFRDYIIFGADLRWEWRSAYNCAAVVQKETYLNPACMHYITKKVQSRNFVVTATPQSCTLWVSCTHDQRDNQTPTFRLLYTNKQTNRQTDKHKYTIITCLLNIQLSCHSNATCTWLPQAGDPGRRR